MAKANTDLKLRTAIQEQVEILAHELRQPGQLDVEFLLVHAKTLLQLAAEAAYREEGSLGMRQSLFEVSPINV